MSVERVLDFIVEIDQLKTVLRKTRPAGLDRYENSAEHSWRENNISRDQVLAVTRRIAKGSEAVWGALEPRVQEATRVLQD